MGEEQAETTMTSVVQAKTIARTGELALNRTVVLDGDRVTTSRWTVVVATKNVNSKKKTKTLYSGTSSDEAHGVYHAVEAFADFSLASRKRRPRKSAPASPDQAAMHQVVGADEVRQLGFPQKEE